MSTPAAALHAGADHPDLPDRRLQPPSLGRTATLPLAAAHPRPGTVGGIAAHPGVHRQHAGRTPRERHKGGQAPAKGRAESYVRGHITILDRQGLEAASCECYQVVKTEFDRLLG